MSINAHQVNDKQFPIVANFNGYGDQKFTLLAAKELATKLMVLVRGIEKELAK